MKELFLVFILHFLNISVTNGRSDIASRAIAGVHNDLIKDSFGRTNLIVFDNENPEIKKLIENSQVQKLKQGTDIVEY